MIMHPAVSSPDEICFHPLFYRSCSSRNSSSVRSPSMTVRSTVLMCFNVPPIQWEQHLLWPRLHNCVIAAHDCVGLVPTELITGPYQSYRPLKLPDLFHKSYYQIKPSHPVYIIYLGGMNTFTPIKLNPSFGTFIPVYCLLQCFLVFFPGFITQSFLILCHVQNLINMLYFCPSDQ